MLLMKFPNIPKRRLISWFLVLMFYETTIVAIVHVQFKYHKPNSILYLTSWPAVDILASSSTISNLRSKRS